MKVTYKNRYGDEFTFEKTDDGNIFMSGSLEYMRWGYPNDYTKAYNAYLHENKENQSLMSFNQFKDAVHQYDDKTQHYTYDRYLKLVETNTNTINMIDASGGPYLCEGMDMGTFSEEFKGMKIREFKRESDGYKILINE